MSGKSAELADTCRVCGSARPLSRVCAYSHAAADFTGKNQCRIQKPFVAVHA